jgi:hypothetical protein
LSPCGLSTPRIVAGHQVISVSTTYPVDVDVVKKFSTWPGVHSKYSSAFGTTKAAELLAVMTAVLSIVAHIPPVRGAPEASVNYWSAIIG